MLKPLRYRKGVPDDAIKPFLLHPDPMVREAIAFYFLESWSEDDELIPLVLESCRRYGEEANFVPLGFAVRFVLSARSVVEAVEELHRSQVPFVEEWLARTPIDLVMSHRDLLRSALSLSAMARVERRRTWHRSSTPGLWQKLSVVCQRLDAFGYEPDALSHVDDLVEALANRESSRAVIDNVRRLDRVESRHWKRALIRLAGAMKLVELTTALVDVLVVEEDDGLATAAAESLVRLHSLSALTLLCQRFESGSPRFRLRALGVLQSSKFEVCEDALCSYLESENDPPIRGRIYDALRFHFTPRATARLREELERPSSWMIEDELKKAIYVHTRLRGVSDPDAVRWRSELEGMGEGNMSFDIPIWGEPSDRGEGL